MVAQSSQIGIRERLAALVAVREQLGLPFERDRWLGLAQLHVAEEWEGLRLDDKPLGLPGVELLIRHTIFAIELAEVRHKHLREPSWRGNEGRPRALASCLAAKPRLRLTYAPLASRNTRRSTPTCRFQPGLPTLPFDLLGAAAEIALDEVALVHLALDGHDVLFLELAVGVPDRAVCDLVRASPIISSPRPCRPVCSRPYFLLTGTCFTTI